MKIEFIEDTHTYLADGVIIPSVSELIRFKFPNAYEGIPTEILKKKASYGTKVHKAIEDFVQKKFTLNELNEQKIDPNIKIAVEEFERLRKEWAFYIDSMEQIVSYKGKYGGTYDIKTIEPESLIIDLKTTSTIHEDWLAWQLGLYYLASNIEKEYGYVIWLPKGKQGEVKQIPVKSFDECKELVKEYEKHNTN